MGINVNQLGELIIKPSLEAVGLYSKEAEQLLLGTCAQESLMGTYIKQVKGPALGIYQMEPATHNDIWINYLNYRKDLRSTIEVITGYYSWNNSDAMVWDLKYATIMARVHYYRVREALPELDDITGMAKYHKKYYNTILGKSHVSNFTYNYRRFVK